MTAPVVLVSGGFDPLHKGHVRLIEAAACLGTVVVALNSDAWLLKKKGYVFMPWTERREVLLALRNVTEVVAVNDQDGSVAAAIREVKPQFFANGGDRSEPNLYEAAACRSVGATALFDIGGGKVQSSSALVAARWFPKGGS